MPSVLVDVSPLLETHWTGIPVYTARLVRLLLADPEIEARFMMHGRRIRKANVVHALEAMTGVYLRNDYERGRCIDSGDCESADKALFPTVKTSFGMAPREASVIHDLTTVVTPEY